MRKIKILIMIILTIFIFFISPTFNIVDAQVTEYSSVLSDLKRDKSFDENDFPILTLEEIDILNSNEDYKDDVKYANVLHLSETKLGNLIVYIYKPTYSILDFNIKYINISIDNGNTYVRKSMKLMSSDGVFEKYLVEDFKINSDTYRYYKIVSIYRDYLESIDNEQNVDFETSCISISCGQNWKVYWLNDELVYKMEKENLVYVKAVHVGSIRMKYGVRLENLWNPNAVDAWYYSFNVENYIVDKIIDADITFDRTDMAHYYRYKNYGGPDDTYDVINEYDIQNITLNHNDEMVFNGDGWFGNSFKWNRIMKGSDFVTSMNEQNAEWTNSSAESLVNSSQWVFSFLETDYDYEPIFGGNSSSDYDEYYSNIDNVGLLRLHFISNGKTYNLGVVSDLESPDDNPDGVGNTKSLEDLFKELYEFLEKVFSILFFIILIVLIVSVVSPILDVIKIIWKLLVLVITLPFKLIGSIFKKKKRK